MYNSILVPIDISEDSLTHMVIPFVQAHTHLTQLKSIFLRSFLRYLIIHL
jgi:universal stress protein F